MLRLIARKCLLVSNKSINSRTSRQISQGQIARLTSLAWAGGPNICPACRHDVLLGRNVTFWSSSKVADWNKAVSDAEKVVGYPTSFMSLRCLLSDELSNVAMQMRKLVGTKHPLLRTARKLFSDGKNSRQTRGLLVLLMSKAAGVGQHNQDVMDSMISGIYPSQRSLAEITEMIHTANLIHKGVVNLSSLQPSDGSLQDMHFGNKMATLSGDFLLANASTELADLHNTYVVEIISSAIGDLMQAEFTKLRDAEGNPIMPTEGATVDDWERQTFLSAGSLLGKSCRAAMLLGGHNVELQNQAFHFGQHIAYTRQLNEDIKSFSNSLLEESLPISATSLPVILLCLKQPTRLQELGLSQNLQINSSQLKKRVKSSGVLDEAKLMCKGYGSKALEGLRDFPDSDAKSALQNIVHALTAL